MNRQVIADDKVAGQLDARLSRAGRLRQDTTRVLGVLFAAQ